MLWTKLSKVLGAMSSVPKRGYNQHFKYEFVRETDLVEAIRPLLAKEGIGVTNCTEEERCMVYEDKRGDGSIKRTFHWVAGGRMVFGCDGDKGPETLEVPWIGESLSTSDKGLAIAITFGVKHSLHKTFLVSTGDDPENHDDAVEHPPSRRAAPQNQRTPQGKPHYREDDGKPTTCDLCGASGTLMPDQFTEGKFYCKPKDGGCGKSFFVGENKEGQKVAVGDDETPF